MVGLEVKGLTTIREVSDPVNWPYAPDLVKKVTENDETFSLKNSSSMTKDASRQNSISDDCQVANWIRVFVPDEGQDKEKEKQLTILEEESENSGVD